MDFRELEQFLEASSPVQTWADAGGRPSAQSVETDNNMDNVFGTQPDIFVHPDHVYRHARELVRGLQKFVP